MANNNLQLRYGLLLILLLCSKNGLAVNYNTYANNQHHLLDDNQYTVAMMRNTNQNQQNPNAAFLNVARNVQDYTGYQQQLRSYYYTPPPTPLPEYQEQSQQHHPSTIQSGSYQPTIHLWPGSPIVVDDVVNQQPSSSTARANQAKATTVFYKQEQQKIPTNSSNTLLPALNRNSNTQTARHLNYNNNNNNNNIVYHKDFRPQIDVIPDTEYMQQQQQDDRITLWYNRQQQQYQRQLQLQMEEEYRKQQQQLQLQQQQQQQQQFYDTNTNLSFNGIANDLRKDNTPADYRELFRRYLENNPQRIKPIY